MESHDEADKGGIALLSGRWRYPAWYDEANCRDRPISEFFGKENETDTQLISPGVLHRAQRICNDCPVRMKCLEHALAKRIMHGIWAGTSGRARARIWAMERRGEVTRTEVLADFASGDGAQYERLRVRVQISASMSR
jgi:WhiB family redox-sensing transcriptional regulator